MDTVVGPAAGDAEGGKGEDAAVAGKETVWERAEDVEGSRGQGAPTRSECKKAHMRAGKGRGGPAQLKAPAVNGGDVTGRASHGVGPTTRAS